MRKKVERRLFPPRALASTISSRSISASAPSSRRGPSRRRASRPYQLIIDFGPAIGLKKSSAQITRNYRIEELVGRQVAAVVNFPPRQIGPIMSEVLTLGFPDADGEVMLFAPDRAVPNGGRLY